MAETPYSKFRLGEDSLSQLDSLAGAAGSRSQAVRDCIAYWAAAVADAAVANAADFSEEDWVLLMAVEPPDYDMLDGGDGRSGSRHWGSILAAELQGRWEGRKILALHEPEVKATRKLAGRVAKLDLGRGYALYAALRWFWSHQATPEQWWRPEVWMSVGSE